MSTHRILVVDSDESVQAGMCRTFANRGYEVATVSSAARGLALAELYAPDLIVLDPAMPGLESLGLVRRLRSTSPTSLIPIIFLADRSEIAERLQGFTLGADNYVRKPVSWDEMRMVVGASLTRAHKAVSRLGRKGHPHDPTISELFASFRGDLEDLGLPSLLSLLEMERKSGTLTVLLKPDDLKARIHLLDGRPIQAKFELLDWPRNENLILCILGRCKGTFRFQTGPVHVEEQIRTSLSELLLEGARRFDEDVRTRPARFADPAVV